MASIPADALRRKFNEGGYWQRALDGALRCCLKSQHPPTGRDHPPHTRGFLVACDAPTGVRVFVAHVFATEAPDGSRVIRASGRPDPKFLVEGGVEYSVSPEDAALPAG